DLAGGDAHPLGRPCEAIAHEDVATVVHVPWHEGGGTAVEHHETTVGGDIDSEAVVSSFETTRGDAHALGRGRLAIANEDVAIAVRVPRDQVVGMTVEEHEAAVSRDHTPVAVGIGLHS